MTNKTVLSKSVVNRLCIQANESGSTLGLESDRRLVSAVEQAVLQSPEIQQALADKKRIDWLADPDNHIGNVQLPSNVVENNVHSLRDAIDSAMELSNHD